MSTLLEREEARLGRKIIRIGRFGENILDEEILKCKASPLTEKSKETSVTYFRELSERRGKETFIEKISLVDPTFSPDHDRVTYSGGFEAEVNMIRDENGVLYPQITIYDGPRTFSVWAGNERKGSGMVLKKMESLKGLDKERVGRVLEILSEVLPKFAEQSPNNKTLQDCINIFGIQKESQPGEK